MIYLSLYLGVGVVMLAVLLISDRRSNPEPSMRPLLDDLDPVRQTTRYKILNKIVVPLLAGALVIFVWPVVPAMKLKDIFWKKAAAKTEELQFAVARGDLIEMVALAHIERRDTVLDPLGAVPQCPFGHLNAAWKTFRIGLQPQDVIWSFRSNWETTWGRKELRAGYVAVRGEVIGAHFLTVWKDGD